MGEKIAFSDKKVTLGRYEIIKRFYRSLTNITYLNELNIPQPNSNRGYDPTILILGFWLVLLQVVIDFLTQIGFWVMIQHCNQYLN